MAKKKAKVKEKKKTREQAAEDLAGGEAPEIKVDGRGGTREGAGRPKKWEPKDGQMFKMQDVMSEGLQARNYGDKSEKALAQAQEHDRRANIMIQRLEPGALDYLVKAIVNTPFNGAAFLTKWGGFKLKKDQENWLMMIWEPTIRFYIPYWLARWGHLALPFILSLPLITHKARGYGEHLDKLKKQRPPPVDSQR